MGEILIQGRDAIARRTWRVRAVRHYPEDVVILRCAVHLLCPAEWRAREVAAYCLSKPLAGRAGNPRSGHRPASADGVGEVAAVRAGKRRPLPCSGHG